MAENIKAAKSLISEMTLDEKIAQLGSYWMWDLQTKGVFDEVKLAEKLNNGIGQITRIGGASTYPPDEIARVGNQIQRFWWSIPGWASRQFSTKRPAPAG